MPRHWLAALALALAAGPLPLLAQTEPAPAAGILLIADAALTGSNFSRTVVLVTRTPSGETIGVILNRRITPDAGGPALPESAKVRDLYFGGPLAPRGLLAVGVVRADAVPPTGALEVLPAVHLVVGAANVRNFIEASEAGRIRVFAGYSGWAPGQLENEIARGAWRVVPAEEAQLFDQAPESLWERLSARLRAVLGPQDEDYRSGIATQNSQRFFGAHVVHPVD